MDKISSQHQWENRRASAESERKKLNYLQLRIFVTPIFKRFQTEIKS